jgi:hypothetical protein
MGLRAFLAICLSLLLVYAPVASAASPAAVGKIQTKGRAEVNGASVPEEATVFAGDRITTAKETASGLTFPGGDQVFLPSLSSAQVNRADNQVSVTLVRGALAVVSRSAQPVVIEANGVRIQAAQPGSAVYEVAVNGTSLKVLAHKGTALVKGSNRTVEVKEGATMEATASPQGGGGLSPLMTIVLLTGAAAGFTGLGLGIAALQRSQPQDCVVVSPVGIKCP